MMNTVREQVQNMTSRELDELAQYITLRRDSLNAQAALKLRVGDKVSFTGKRGRYVTGLVEGFKRRGVVLLAGCSDGMRWRVPASMLSPVLPKAA